MFVRELIDSRPALRAVFDHISLQIENLVSEQIAEVSDKDLAVKVKKSAHYRRSSANLGQGNTPRRRLWREQIPIRSPGEMPRTRRYTSDASQRSVRVFRFHLPYSRFILRSRRWSSICRGATLWGLEHSDQTSITSSPTVVSRLSRYSYGMALSQIYDPTRHLSEDVYLDTADGTYKARGQMKWLLRRVRPTESSIALVRVLTAA